jgi:hypothetical protein
MADDPPWRHLQLDGAAAPPGSRVDAAPERAGTIVSIGRLADKRGRVPADGQGWPRTLRRL